ncbi:MAG TPA: EF-hand domain-containing protein [Pirellula sp.]|nr:EF-hand domain-containing protein [Pirellula sp.]
MNATNNVTNPTKGRPTSIPLLICVGLLGLAAALAGPTVMTYYFFYQEEAKAQAIYKSAGNPSASGPGGVATSPGRSAVGGTPVGGDGQRRDPEEIFKQRDENANGKLDGSEISERMQARMVTVDKNGDGVISKEEFMEGMQRRAGGDTLPAATELKPDTAKDQPVKETLR